MTFLSHSLLGAILDDTMRTLDVILRTHSGPNVHAGERALKVPKTELILGCLRSLIASLKRVDSSRYCVRLAVLDDHSEPVCVSGIKEQIAKLPFETKFIPLGSRGVGPSFGSSYTYARDVSEDLIYFVEDDYLHSPDALPEMLEAQEIFSLNLGGREVGIFPVDYPDNYDPRWMRPSYVVIGPRRHWHTDFSTTGTFMVSRNAFLKNFDFCMKMSQYMIDPSVNEATSINHMWSDGGVQLFSPLPSLAIHMQGVREMPPFVDWEKWWKGYAN